VNASDQKDKVISPWQRFCRVLRFAYDELLPTNRSLNDPLERRIHVEQLKLCLAATEKLILTGPLFGASLIIFLSPWASIQHVALFFVSQVVAALWCYSFQRRIAAVPDLAPRLPRHMLHYRLMSLYYTISFHSFAYWAWVPGDIANHYLIVAALAGSAGLGILVSNASWGVFLNYFIPVSILAVVAPLQEPDLLHISISVGSFLYLVLGASLAYRVHEGTRAMICLRFALEAKTDELERARARAELASLAKSRFLANMSHELRTPLNAIIGFSELVVTTTKPTDKNADYARHIFSSGQHLLLLINDILDLSKIEAGHFEPDESDVNVKAVIETAIKMSSIRADHGNLTLISHIEDELPFLFADERAMRQIILNLVSNAIKFTEPGGSVTVFAGQSPGGNVVLGVRDTGVGISPDQMALVFERFGQARHDISVAERGTGLGLPIVKGLAEAHGADVQLESALGHGTTVTVIFPQSRVRPPKAKQEAAA
jgi:two-component system cell cycle sensor histidine kinase PleC